MFFKCLVLYFHKVVEIPAETNSSASELGFLCLEYISENLSDNVLDELIPTIAYISNSQRNFKTLSEYHYNLIKCFLSVLSGLMKIYSNKKKVMRLICIVYRILSTLLQI